MAQALSWSDSEPCAARLDHAPRKFPIDRLRVGLWLFDVAMLLLGSCAAGGMAAQIDGDAELTLALAAAGNLESTLLYAAVAWPVGAYDLGSRRAGPRRLSRLTVALWISVGIPCFCGLACRTSHGPNLVWLGLWLLFSVTALVAARVWAVTLLEGRLTRGLCVKRALSIGIGCAPAPAASIAALTGGRSKAAGTLTIATGTELQSVVSHVRAGLIEQIFLTLPVNRSYELPPAARDLRHLAVEVFILPEGADGSLCLPVVNLTPGGGLGTFGAPMSGVDAFVKRAGDLAGAAALLLGLAPLMLLIALAIRSTSPGPVLFRQTRLGFNGVPFTMMKFRSMRSDPSPGALQTTPDDPRVTRVGRLLRRTSLDELPQLFNVLAGHMSLVGPRPHALGTRTDGQALEDALADYAARHRVKPGLTGLAQVQGLRGELRGIDALKRRVACDMRYIDGWSMALDIGILLRTVRLVFHDRHAF